MGQKVQMDEHEGGFWSPVLCGLAEPVCKTRPWQSRHLPVHCVKKKLRGCGFRLTRPSVDLSPVNTHLNFFLY